MSVQDRFAEARQPLQESGFGFPGGVIFVRWFGGQAVLQKNPGGAVTKTPRDAGHEELQALDLDRLIRK